MEYIMLCFQISEANAESLHFTNVYNYKYRKRRAENFSKYFIMLQEDSVVEKTTGPIKDRNKAYVFSRVFGKITY